MQNNAPNDPDQVSGDGRTAHSERSRQLLLDAAFEEFAEHGYAGTRVAAIAARAGLNKQLISYHFGGKRGLYEQLQAQWTRREQEFRRDDPSLPELVLRYLDAALSDPRAVRLATRQALDGGFPASPANNSDLDDLRERQARGQLAADLDPGAVLLAIMGMVTAPIILSSSATELINDDHQLYAQQLAAIIAHLAPPPTESHPD